MSPLIVVPRQPPFEVQTSGNLFGKIHWRIKGEAFPANDWDDFIVTILNWWCIAMTRHLRRGSSQHLSFMDGPYFVLVSAGTGALCELNFCRRRVASTKVLARLSVPTASLVRSLIDAADTTLRKCRRMQVTNENIEALKNERGKLTSQLAATLEKSKRTKPEK